MTENDGLEPPVHGSQSEVTLIYTTNCIISLNKTTREKRKEYVSALTIELYCQVATIGVEPITSHLTGEVTLYYTTEWCIIKFIINQRKA